MDILRKIVSSAFLVALVYLTVLTVLTSQERQRLVYDRAEINNIQYGLLSIHSWKYKITDVLTKKVQEFELTTESRKELREKIERGLHLLLDHIEEVMREKRTTGNIFKRIASGITQLVVEELIVDINSLRTHIPEFTKELLNELDNKDTREKLRVFIQKKVDEFFLKTVGEQDLTAIVQIVEQYGGDNIEDCRFYLETEITQKNHFLTMTTYVIVSGAFLVFFILLFKNNQINIFEYIILILTVLILLVGGLLTPMIDIEANIKQFEFILIGEPISFDNQILFFQSKSIFNVFWILIETGKIQSVFVGILILVFSILFPLLKIILAMFVINKPELTQNKIINLLVFKSGKWSMADVFVIAIFMAYIGFTGILDSQLDQLENMGESLKILTMNNSNFGSGFILFTSFCLLSIKTSSVIKHAFKPN